MGGGLKPGNHKVLCGIRKRLDKPLAVIWIYLLRNGAELRRVSTVTKDHTVV